MLPHANSRRLFENRDELQDDEMVYGAWRQANASQLDDQTHYFYVHSINISEIVCESLSWPFLLVAKNVLQSSQFDLDGMSTGKAHCSEIVCGTLASRNN